MLQNYLSAIQNMDMLPEIIYSICAVLLFSRIPNSGRAWAQLGGQAFLLLCAKVLVKKVLLLVPIIGPVLDSFGTVYLLNPLILLLTGLCLRELRISTRLVSGVVFSAVYILGMGFVPHLIREVFDISPSEIGKYPLNSVLLITLAATTVFLLKKFSIEEIPALSRYYMSLVIFVSVAAAVTAPVFITSFDSDKQLITFCTVYHLFAIILTLTVYCIFYYGSREYNDLIAAAVITQKQQAESRMLELTESNLEEIRKFRHDIKNHYAVMEELLRDKDYEKLQAYFDQLSVRKNIFTTIRTGNRAVDAILNTKAVEATSRGVTLEAKCAVPPELPIKDTQLCSLLFNLLDNAIDAAAASSGKEVDLSLLRKDNLLLLRVRNSVDAATAARPLSLHTTKPNAAAHGYGMQIIRQIVAEYNGTSQFALEDGYFVAEIMLTLEGSGKGSVHG